MGIRSYIERLESAYRDRVLLLLIIRLAWLFLAIVLAYVALDAAFGFAGWVRVALGGLALAGLAGCVAWSARMAFRSRAYGRMLARMMETGNPALENSLSNALDFDERLAEDGATRFSQALMAREIENATERVTAIESYDALTPPALKRESLALGGLAAATVVGMVLFHAVFLAVIPRYLFPFGDFPPYTAIRFAVDPGTTTVDFGDNLKIEVTTTRRVPEALTLVLLDDAGVERDAVEMHNAGDGVFFQTLENLRTPVTYLARAERGRTRKYHIGLNTVPRIEEVVVEYTYPAYTQLDAETRILSEPVLTGYKDTRVTMRIRSNRPLEGGSITIDGAEHAFQSGPEASIVEAEFPITEAGAYHAQIVDVDGNRASEAIRGTIEIIPDRKPEVVIATPGMDSFAVPDSKIPILVDANDDLGISKVTIYRRHNESADARKDLYEDPGRESFVTVDETLDLKDLGVRPGDTIDYYVTATDSRPAAPQTATSEMFRLAIISFEEYREYAQSQMTAEDLREKYDAILDEMAALAEAQEALKETTEALEAKMAEGGTLSEAEKDQLALAEQEQAALAAEAADLAERLEEMVERPVVFDIEESYKEALGNFAERLDEANAAMEEARAALGEAGQMSPASGAPMDGSEQGPAGQPGQEVPAGESGEAGDTPPGAPAQSPMQRASAAQQAALDQLAENVQEFQEGIQQANENLEHVANVMGDVEQFKYLYNLQKSLERSIGFYKQMIDISADDQVRLDELSAQQAEVMVALAALKEDLRIHAEELDALASKQKGASDVFIQKP